MKPIYLYSPKTDRLFTASNYKEKFDIIVEETGFFVEFDHEPNNQELEKSFYIYHSLIFNISLENTDKNYYSLINITNN